jgi:hypothetical protein
MRVRWGFIRGSDVGFFGVVLVDADADVEAAALFLVRRFFCRLSARTLCAQTRAHNLSAQLRR